MQNPISITAVASISPLGHTSEAVWQSYINSKHCFSKKENDLVACLLPEAQEQIQRLKQENTTYQKLDNSVLLALFASREASKQAGWKANDNFGINIGSSRGATQLFETYYSGFLSTGKTHTLSSPTTTLGNISSWVAHDLQSKGPTISHSITCSTALHAMLNGIAWIASGMSDRFLVGGSEAPLTPFTIAQMKALKIYQKTDFGGLEKFPCQPLKLDKIQNTMILGEGAAVACLENGLKHNAIAVVCGFGYATEPLEHHASLSANADCFQRSMSMALENTNPDEIDVIVTHTPGTIKGDMAELNAITSVFKNKMPALTNNKWKTGHTLGASGMLSIEMAIIMLQLQTFIQVPFLEFSPEENIETIMVNAVGFGGNAVSIILKKP